VGLGKCAIVVVEDAVHTCRGLLEHDRCDEGLLITMPELTTGRLGASFTGTLSIELSSEPELEVLSASRAAVEKENQEKVDSSAWVEIRRSTSTHNSY
jgi:hypothetical protein